MKVLIRKAEEKDAVSFLEIKARLPMPSGNSATRSGGFLMGTDLPGYLHFINHAIVKVLDVNESPAGFAIILPDAMVRASALVEKVSEMNWTGFSPELFNGKRVCFYEQLAVLPGENFRSWSVMLAFAAVSEAFSNHDLLAATIVN